MIDLVPSISVYDGKCVRLIQGDYSKQIAYEESPLEFANRFEEHGVKKVHLIDLEGTKAGQVVNYESLDMIASHTGLEVNFGGGIHTDGDVQKAYEYGAKIITVGSMAYTNRKLFGSWLFSHGRDRIMLSADAKDGKIRIGGWQKETELDLMEHVEYYYERAVQYVKCSDVARDGLTQGPNFAIYQAIKERFPEIRLYASGGVGSMDDIKRLEDLGVDGVIFGKAFYDQKITLKDLDKFLSR